MVMGCHIHFLTKAPSPKILAEAFSDIRPNVVYAVPLIVEKIYKSLVRTLPADADLCKALKDFFGGDFELALNGDDNNMGFEEIISTYGDKAGEAVYLYAGACALQTGDFDKALKYFKKYAGEDKILLSRAQAGIGDAYVGLEDYKSALAAYEKAAATADNLSSRRTWTASASRNWTNCSRRTWRKSTTCSPTIPTSPTWS